MSKRFIAFLLTLITLVPAMHAAAAPPDVGVVLLHGKWGRPQNVLPLARQLESAGYPAQAPEMAWSARRLYDVDYPAALKEIEKHVSQLRARGAKRVIIAGQSMGANAAVAYAYSGLDADGLVLMSPGHFPERGMGRRVREHVARARAMAAGGQADESAGFVNQGRSATITATARNYLSYFDAEGLGASTRNIRSLARPIPLLLAIGTRDPFYPDAKAMFDSAPVHRASRYLVLETDHANVPAAVAPELLKWLESLARQAPAGGPHTQTKH